ncbi:MAG: UDP-2,4-diacetamido-2,4,6-trideoxy-beta-L-altropyranose hydrolase [Ruminococcus sp.]|nr:UDP-2,4-diacetamido-2,4,6-trideoxy-beta-L-altropyranose hydrolase [Ruminococcus sp.]
MSSIGIRVDSNTAIAMGHLMRCMAVAEALREKEVKPIFISADKFSEGFILKRGYEFISLESDWSCLELEIEKMQQVIKEYSIKVLLVDSYYITERYLSKLHEYTKIVYIDDFGKDIYDIDAVICYANYYKEFKLKERYPLGTNVLQGMRFVPLRKVFSTLPQKEISLKVKELVVLSGGTDYHNFLWNFTRNILESTLFERLERVNLICGNYSEQYDKLTKEFAGVRKIHFYKAVDDIEKYMLRADVAISAAGVTSYELCAAGVPSIIYIVADNQRKNAETFHKNGLMEYAGDLRYDPVLNRVIKLLEGKYQDYAYRKETSEMMRREMDGRGAWRIAEEIKIM